MDYRTFGGTGAAVLSQCGVSTAQIALAWTVERPAVTSVILGVRTVEQLDDSLAAAGLHLSAEDPALLDEASEPIVRDYPFGPRGRQQRASCCEL